MIRNGGCWCNQDALALASKHVHRLQIPETEQNKGETFQMFEGADTAFSQQVAVLEEEAHPESVSVPATETTRSRRDTKAIM